MTRMLIHCCGCSGDVSARLTDGKEIYPHRPDLRGLPFWKCDKCGNFVGCHHKTPNRTRPLGCIPTPEIKEGRKRIHAVIDPVWHSGRVPRGKLYASIGKELGRDYHTADTRSIEDIEAVYQAATNVIARLGDQK